MGACGLPHLLIPNAASTTAVTAVKAVSRSFGKGLAWSRRAEMIPGIRP